MGTRTPRWRRWRLWVAAIASIGLVATGVATLAWRTRSRAEPLEVYGSVPDFSLVERSGRTVTRADLLGNVSVVDFFYARCVDACPLQSAHLARLQADFAGTPDARLVSITVDPDHDSPGVLSAYAARFHADPHRWLFLTGPRDAIYRLAVDGFHLATVTSRQRKTRPTTWVGLGPSRAWAHEERASLRMSTLVHSSRFALVDRQGRIRGYFDGLDWADVERLGKHLKELLGEH